MTIDIDKINLIIGMLGFLIVFVILISITVYAHIGYLETKVDLMSNRIIIIESQTLVK